MTLEEFDEKVAEIFNDLIDEVKKSGERIEAAAEAARNNGVEDKWIGLAVVQRQKEYAKACAEL